MLDCRGCSSNRRGVGLAQTATSPQLRTPRGWLRRRKQLPATALKRSELPRVVKMSPHEMIGRWGDQLLASVRARLHDSCGHNQGAERSGNGERSVDRDRSRSGYEDRNDSSRGDGPLCSFLYALELTSCPCVQLALPVRRASLGAVSEVSELAMMPETHPRALAAGQAGTRPGPEVLGLGAARDLRATQLTNLTTALTGAHQPPPHATTASVDVPHLVRVFFCPDFPVGPLGIAT